MKQIAPKIIFVLGGPGSGKGTQSQLIQKNFQYHHISAGDELRAERASGSQNAQVINEMIQSGKIVPSHITIQLLQNKMEKLGWDNGKFLIDGFPRSEENYESWFKLMSEKTECKFCLFIDVPFEVLEKRIKNRNQGRDDDSIEVLKQRFDTYNNATMPIIQRFTDQGLCQKINGDGDIDAVFGSISKLFE